MSLFVEHTSCPSCGSRDNLAIYSDHEFCFGCGHLVFYNDRRYLPNKEHRDVPTVSLPMDIEPLIPAVADSWLRKYGLTQRELFDNRVVWSEFRQLLIFPYTDHKGFLWGWQGRYFGQDPEHPKWTGKGNFKGIEKVYEPKDRLTNQDNNVIIIVEDIISTIKTSRLYNSTCLFGSYIDINKYIKYYNLYKPKSFIIWLDKDKQKEAYQYMLSFTKLGIPASVISTDLDPKEYSTEEIRRIVESETTNP